TTRRSGGCARRAPWRISRRSPPSPACAGPKAAPRTSAPAMPSTRTPRATPPSRARSRPSCANSRAAQVVDSLHRDLDLPQRVLVDGLLRGLVDVSLGRGVLGAPEVRGERAQGVREVALRADERLGRGHELDELRRVDQARLRGPGRLGEVLRAL